MYSSKEMVNKLNDAMVEGMRILSVRQVEEGKAGKAMSLVAAADYVITFREGKEPSEDWKQRITGFMDQPCISIVKKQRKVKRK